MACTIFTQIFVMKSGMLPTAPTVAALSGSLLWISVTDTGLVVDIKQKLGELVSELEECLSSQQAHPTFVKDGVYDFKSGRAYAKITAKFGLDIRVFELQAIASTICKKIQQRGIQLKMTRDAKRKKSELYRWFDQHWDQVGPMVEKVVFVQSDDDDEEEDGQIV